MALGSLRSRQEFEDEELQRLAPGAVKSAQSQGRVVSEPSHPYRTEFQRDRDRIVHCWLPQCFDQPFTVLVRVKRLNRITRFVETLSRLRCRI